MQAIDTINTQSQRGRNLTPISLLASARAVLGRIDLDPASDAIANKGVKAARIYTPEDDGYSKIWIAQTLWLNAPGQSISQGRKVTAAQWYRKLYYSYKRELIGEALALVYRASSLGSLGHEFLSEAVVCLTAAGASSKAINGSGRLNFDLVRDGARTPTYGNTGSSAIVLLSDSKATIQGFKDEFSQYGAVKI